MRIHRALIVSTGWRLVLVVLLVVPVSLMTPAAPTEAGGGVSRVIPFAGLIGSLHARNRIYRTANAYMKEKNELYDRYREKAREQLANRKIRSLRDSQVSAYVKVVGLIEGERTAMEDYAESEKRAAREQFLDTVEQTIMNRILASTAVTQVLGALTKGLNSSQSFIDTVVSELSGGGGGALAELQRARVIAGRVSMVGGLIGGPTGAKMQSLGTRVDVLLGRPIDEIKAGLVQVQGDLSDLSGDIEDLKGRGVTLTPSEAGREALISLVTGEDADPAIAKIVDMLTGRTGRGDGTFRGRAREALIGSYVVRCAAMGRRILEALAALNQTTMDPEQVDLCKTIDIDAIVREAEAAVATSEAQSGEPPAQSNGEEGLQLISLEVVDGWCFPKPTEDSENHICGYTVNWVFEYKTEAPPAKMICYVYQVDHYKSRTFAGTTLEEQGIWSDSLPVTGFYPSPGEYTESISCELREGNFETGALHASFEAPITAPLTTIRQP